MGNLVIKISTNAPDSFIDLFVPLAHNLEGSGKVYQPVPVVDPQARMAVPPADHILVTLSSLSAFSRVYQTIRDYVEGHQNSELSLQRVVDTAITVTAGSLPDEDRLRREMFP